jgi:gamma-glutamylcyclotransferase (GGCT)/AIG2-like uncharacterized protein YtfP
MEKFFKVFVYGTLKRGERNFYVLEDKRHGFSEFQANGRTKEKFPLVVGEFEGRKIVSGVR